MRARLLVLACAVLCLTTGSAFAQEPTLQDVLDGITVAPNPGVSSVNVATDALPDAFDSLWSISGSGAASSTMIIELATLASYNNMGVYDAANPSNIVQLFSGFDSAGDQAYLSILADGTVRVNGVPQGSFAGNRFGFYLTAAPVIGTFYSDTGLNTDLADHMLAFQGTDTDTIQIPPYAAGLWTSNEFILGWEDLPAGISDFDYQDMVVIVESVVPVVPLPGAVLLGVLGLAFAGRKLRQIC